MQTWNFITFFLCTWQNKTYCRILCFRSYKNRKIEAKLWEVGAHQRKKRSFFVPFVLFQGIFLALMFYLNAWCIEYTFRIYILLHIKKHYFIHSLLVFKIVKSLQCILTMQDEISSQFNKLKFQTAILEKTFVDFFIF